MDEGFTAAAYPDVQENLKLKVVETRFGDQFLNDKPSEADNEKTTADTEAESMVSVTIQQDISVFPPMTSPVIGPVPRPDSPNVHGPLPTTTTTTVATTTTTLPLPPQPQTQGSHLSYDMKVNFAPRMLEDDRTRDMLTNRVAFRSTAGLIRRDESEPVSPPSPQPPPYPPPSLSNHQGGKSTSTTAPSSQNSCLRRDHFLHVQLEQSGGNLFLTKVRPPHSRTCLDITSLIDYATQTNGLDLKSTYAPHRRNSPFAQTGDMAMFYGLVHKLLTDQLDDTILRLQLSKPFTGCSGLMRSASMTSQLCMVSLTGGFKDNDSTLTDSHLKETAEQ
ncbi:hypothetical protein Tco_0554073 [Tanacetum coccineum]